MLKATTLVHKGAMEIAVHSVRTFAKNFAETHYLHIHTDTSTDDGDHKLLLAAAQGMDVKIISGKERGEKIIDLLAGFPVTKDFLNRASYFAKLELPMYEGKSYVYFDSDVIWLRPVVNLAPVNSPNAFSTESWTWYNGIVNDQLWLQTKTPRRVNSGVHYIGESFPFEKMEDMLQKNMFNREMTYAGDQEIFAYLFNNLEYYHPADVKRSRVLSLYQLQDVECAALHFPGKMWLQHMDQIKNLYDVQSKPSLNMRYQPAVPLSPAELFKMRAQIQLGRSTLLAHPLNIFRKLRRAYR